MRFLVDECAGPALANWLAQQGFEVFSVFDLAQGTPDTDLLAKAAAEEWVLVTTDKDFGEMVFRDQRAHSGVVLLRLQDERSAGKIRVMAAVLVEYSERLPGRFVTATETKIRIN